MTESSLGIAMIGLGRWGNTIAEQVVRTPGMRLVTCYTRIPYQAGSLQPAFQLRAGRELRGRASARGRGGGHYHGTQQFARRTDRRRGVAREARLRGQADLHLDQRRPHDDPGVRKGGGGAGGGRQLPAPARPSGLQATPGGGRPGDAGLGEDELFQRPGPSLHPGNLAMVRNGLPRRAAHAGRRPPDRQLLLPLRPGAPGLGLLPQGGHALGDPRRSGAVAGVRVGLASFISPLSPKGRYTYFLNAYGTEANFYHDRWEGIFLFCKGGEEKERVPCEEYLGFDYLGEELADFENAVRTGQPPEVGGEDGLHVLAVVRTALRSAELGRPVDLAEVLEE